MQKYQCILGENYPRLLKVKETWDPGNVFHHCQSVGSTDNSCCPFTLDRQQGPPRDPIEGPRPKVLSSVPR